MLFSWYVATFDSYNRAYGSLGAAIGFMVWLWISAVIRSARRRAECRDGAPDRSGYDGGESEAAWLKRRDDGGSRWSRSHVVKRREGVFSSLSTPASFLGSDAGPALKRWSA